MNNWNNEWQVSDTLDDDELNSVTARISEYYHAESKKTKYPVYPRHHALILAALSSSSKLVSRAFPATVVSGYERCVPPTQQQQMFTTTALSSRYQKGHLTALAGMTGLLLTRLRIFMPTPTPTPTRHHQTVSLKTKKKYTEITQQYIHSALAAEYLLGNRYYRRASSSVVTTPTATTTPLEKEKQPVGFVVCDINSKRAAHNNDAIATMKELHKLYNANIDRLSLMIQQYKRGFVCRDAIRADPEFVRMMSAFWETAQQHMKIKDEFEAQSSADPLSRMWFPLRKNAKRITMVSMVAETAVLNPGLYDYDVAHIFDNAIGSYAKYIQSVKSTLVRLAGDGSNASFLAFAAIEPTMVTEDYAPRIGGNPAEYHGLSLMSCANYIQSRDPVFGELKKRHSCHMIRTADAVNMSFGRVYPREFCSPARGVCRDQDRLEPKYAPFYEMVEEARRKDTILENVDWNFEKKCENTGEIICAFQALREFRERVWPSFGSGIRGEYIPVDYDDDERDDIHADYSDDDDYYGYGGDGDGGDGDGDGDEYYDDWD